MSADTRRRAARVLATLAAALLYWWGVARWGGVAEPWDVPRYWSVFYPGSLILSAVAGSRAGWSAGVLVTSGQLPVVLVQGGAGPLLPVGLLFLALLSIPAILAALAGRFALHRTTGSPSWRGNDKGA